MQAEKKNGCYRFRETRALWWIAGCMVVVSSALWSASTVHPPRVHALAHEVYTAAGWGGFVGVHKPVKLPPLSEDPLRPAREAYYAGHYAQAERLAQSFLSRLPALPSERQQHQEAMAYLIWAYSAARQHRFSQAYDLFLRCRSVAEALPDHGAPKPVLGEMVPTLEEEAAYEAVCCLQGEGKRQEAEAGYLQFLRDYPQSILIHGATLRLRWLHHGNLSGQAEALWRADEHAQILAEAECAPACLAEVLRRQGRWVSVGRLAQAMHTGEHGTSLAALAEVAQKEGLHPKGLQLSWQGLMRQPRPLIAWVAPQHFVVVTQVKADGVRVWDPTGAPQCEGAGKPAEFFVPKKQWLQQWQQVGLVFGK